MDQTKWRVKRLPDHVKAHVHHGGVKPGHQRAAGTGSGDDPDASVDAFSGFCHAAITALGQRVCCRTNPVNMGGRTVPVGHRTQEET